MTNQDQEHYSTDRNVYERFYFKVHVGPTMVGPLAKAFLCSGAENIIEGTETLYFWIGGWRGSDKCLAWFLNNLREHSGTTFGLAAHFRLYAVKSGYLN